MTDKKTDKVMIQANGMPVRDEPSPGALKTVPFLLIPLAIGTGIAAATYKFGDTALYDRKIAAAIANDAHWGALGALLFTRAVGFVNFFPMQLKAGIVGFEGDNGPEGMNLRANPFYYKVIGEGASKDWTVIFQTDGAMGKYNRAQRSIHHMVENFGTLLITMPVVSACCWCWCWAGAGGGAAAADAAAAAAAADPRPRRRRHLPVPDLRVHRALGTRPLRAPVLLRGGPPARRRYARRRSRLQCFLQRGF